MPASQPFSCNHRRDICQTHKICLPLSLRPSAPLLVWAPSSPSESLKLLVCHNRPISEHVESSTVVATSRGPSLEPQEGCMGVEA